MEGIVGVLGGRAEPLVKAIMPLPSPTLVLAFYPNLTVGLCHLVFLQCIVHDLLRVPLPLLSSHLRVQAASLIQNLVLLSSSQIELLQEAGRPSGALGPLAWTPWGAQGSRGPGGAEPRPPRGAPRGQGG